jgi:hypothetical protein
MQRTRPHRRKKRPARLGVPRAFHWCAIRPDVLPDEGTGTCQGETPGFQMRIPKRPGMNHVRPDLERDRDVSSAGSGGEANRVVEQCLVGPDLNERRRESAQAGIKRRYARVLPVEVYGQQSPYELFQITLVDERIDGFFAREACTRHGQVGPLGKEPYACRLLGTGRPQVVDQRHREPAASAIAGDGDLRRRDALLLQKAPSGQRIVEGSRKRMLRRQPIRNRKRAYGSRLTWSAKTP